MKKLGQIQLANFAGAANMPQKPQSAWTGAGFDNPEMTGAKFKPLLFAADQLVNGTNYYYIAERTIIYKYEIRNLVLLMVHETTSGEYEFDDDNVVVIL